MSALLSALLRHADRNPRGLALDDLAGSALSWREVCEAVGSDARVLSAVGVRSLGLLADNGVPWVLTDLASHVLGVPTVPLAPFFSDAQIEHVCDTADLDTVVTDQPDRMHAFGFTPELALHGGRLWLCSRHEGGSRLPAVQKVTFTSGTTGTPKGVCLGRTHLERVAETLRDVTGSLASDVHLCVLPLSILLENVAGVHRSLLAGGTVLVPSLARVGVSGAQQFDPFVAIRTIREHEVTSAILVPEMLRGLSFAARDGSPTRLRYVGVGGARVAPDLLDEAQARSIPAYEGYGLSEFGSVVALNTPDRWKRGASGAALPHVRIRISPTSEIEIHGPRFHGYLTPKGMLEGTTTRDGWFRTGDLGDVDEDGFVRVTGRARNVLITSYGRNVSPEWVESELLTHPGVAQAVVFGDGEPVLQAVLVLRTDPGFVADHLASVNARLPDYARIGRCVITQTPLGAIADLTLASGQPRREIVAAHFARASAENSIDMEQDRWAFTLAS